MRGEDHGITLTTVLITGSMGSLSPSPWTAPIPMMQPITAPPNRFCGLALHFCCTEEELALIANDATIDCLGRDAESVHE